MNWDAVGAIGEIIGAIAVVLTLLYLAAQIRQTNRHTQSAALQEMSSGFNEMNGWIANDESLAKIWSVGVNDYGKLSEHEATRLSFALLATFHTFETIFLQNQMGTIQSAVWNAERRSIRALIALPGVRQWWEGNPYAFTDEFRKFVNAEIQSAI